MAVASITRKTVFDLNSGCVFTCSVKGANVSMEKAWAMPAGLAEKILMSGAEVSGNLKSMLSDEGIQAGKNSIVVIPMRNALVRHFVLPTVDNSELAEMVGYEAFQLLPVSPEQWHWSYGAMSADDTSDISFHAVRKETIENCSACFSAAGIKLKAVYPASACFPMNKSEEKTMFAIILQSADDLQLMISDAGGVVYVRSIKAGENGSLISEVGLTLDDYISNSQRMLEKIVFLKGPGGDDDFSDVLVEEFGSEIELKTWTDLSWLNAGGTETSGLPAGVVLGAEAARLSSFPDAGEYNLLPQVSRKVKIEKRIRLLYATIALVVIVATAVLGNAGVERNRQNSEELELLDSKIESLEPRVVRLNEIRGQLEAFSISGVGSFGSMDVLKELSIIMPRERVKITRLFFEKDGEVHISGQAEAHANVMELIAEMDNSVLFAGATLDFSRESEEYSKKIVNFEISAEMAAGRN